MDNILGSGNCLSAVSGLTGIYFLPMSEVVEIPDNAKGIYYYEDVYMYDLLAAHTMQKVDFNKETGFLREEKTNTEQGVVYEQVVECECAKHYLTKRNNLYWNDEAEFLLLVKDNDGNYYVMGEKDGFGQTNGMRLTYSSTSGANPKKDDNVYKLVWKRKSDIAAKIAIVSKKLNEPGDPLPD